MPAFSAPPAPWAPRRVDPTARILSGRSYESRCPIGTTVASSPPRKGDWSMAETNTEAATVKPTLGLTGVTMNAMALIAPGAFLWITYQLQAAATAPDGSSVASDIWAGIVAALLLAFLTALSYAQLARLYPEAGFGSCYYFAEKAFLDRENKSHHRFARLAKLVTGWAAHLFYWVYPGCMVAFMATLIGYIWQQFTGATLSWTSLAIICALFAA